MDTALEALFRFYLGASGTYADPDDYDGDCEAPTGAFTRVSIDDEFITFVHSEYDESGGYGFPDREDMLGHWLLTLSDQGIVGSTKFDTRASLDSAYDALVTEYTSYLDN